MSENGFVAFAPRRLVRIEAPALVADDVAPIEHEDGPANTSPATGAVADPGDHGDKTDVTTAESPRIPDAASADAVDRERLRAAAIDLAAAACARALGYAVDRNPRLVARFVEDALRAAGDPEHAVIRVAAQSASVVAQAGVHEIVADATLSPGDVFVNCASGTLGATLGERAERLVRALAT